MKDSFYVFRDEARPFSLQGWEVAGTNWNTENGIWTKLKAGRFYYESGWTLVQTGSGGYIFDGIWNQTGHSPKQPVLLDLTLSRDGWIENCLRLLLTSAILRVCKTGSVREHFLGAFFKFRMQVIKGSAWPLLHCCLVYTHRCQYHTDSLITAMANHLH